MNKIDFVLKSGKKISQLFNLKLTLAKLRKGFYLIKKSVKFLYNKEKRNNFVKKIKKKYEDFVSLQPTLDEFFLNFLTKASYQFSFHLLRSVLWAYMVARGWITTLPPMLMGGFVIPTGDGTNTNDPTEMFGKSKLPLVKYEKEVDPLTETPPKDVSKFVAVVANNTCELREFPYESRYKTQFQMFARTNRAFNLLFPTDWDEFKSCNRYLIITTINTEESGALAVPVNEKSRPDIFTASGQACQIKTVSNLYAHDIFAYMQKYFEHLQKNNLTLHLMYKDLKKPEDLFFLKQNTPEFVLKNTYLHKLPTMQRVTPEHVDFVFGLDRRYPRYLQDSHALLNKVGWMEYARLMKRFPK